MSKGINKDKSEELYILLSAYYKARVFIRGKSISTDGLMLLLTVYYYDGRIYSKDLSSLLGVTLQQLVRIKKQLVVNGYLEDNYNLILSDKGLSICLSFLNE